MASEILIFNHIKKTAGSTLRYTFYQVYRGRHVHVMYAYPGARFETYGEHMAALNESLAPTNPKVKAIVSHAGFGLHEVLPAQHTYRQFTMLRDPVQRTISMYHFAVQNGSYPEGTSLEVFLADTERAYNVQTAYLGGLILRENIHGQPLRRGDYDAALLARAKENLLDHDVFGLTERFDESLALAAETLGWPPWKIGYTRRNVGKARRKRPALTPDQIELVREHNRLDLDLYAFAVDHFERLLNERVPDVGARLRTLERANRLHDFAQPLLQLRRRARRAAHTLGLR